MRRFLLTNSKFKGQVELVYNIDGHIQRIDLSETDMTVEQRYGAVCKVPLTIHHLENKVGLHESTIVVEAEFEVSFEEFWREYPYKRNRHLAEAYWQKMDKTSQVLAWIAAKAYRKYCEKNSKWYNPQIAETWLKKKEYQNQWHIL